MSRSRLVSGSVILAATLAAGVLAQPRPAAACGSEPFIGEICLFGYSFCPRGFAEAQGQLLSISANTALFSLYGTSFGGDGRTTFGLPDLRGRSPVNVGQGAGLANVNLGEMRGAETTTLQVGQLPAHTHAATTALSLQSSLHGATSGNVASPSGAVPGTDGRSTIYSNQPATVTMGPSAIVASGTATTTVAPTGSGQPATTLSPQLGLRYCVAVNGIYPSRD